MTTLRTLPQVHIADVSRRTAEPRVIQPKNGALDMGRMVTRAKLESEYADVPIVAHERISSERLEDGWGRQISDFDDCDDENIVRRGAAVTALSDGTLIVEAQLDQGSVWGHGVPQNIDLRGSALLIIERNGAGRDRSFVIPLGSNNLASDDKSFFVGKVLERGKEYSVGVILESGVPMPCQAHFTMPPGDGLLAADGKLARFCRDPSLPIPTWSGACYRLGLKFFAGALLGAVASFIGSLDVRQTDPLAVTQKWGGGAAAVVFAIAAGYQGVRGATLKRSDEILLG